MFRHQGAILTELRTQKQYKHQQSTLVAQCVVLGYVMYFKYPKTTHCATNVECLCLCSFVFVTPWGWHISDETCRSFLRLEWFIYYVYLLLNVTDYKNKHGTYNIKLHTWWAGTAQLVQRVATGWTIRGSNPGGDEVFHTRPYWPWGPSSPLYKEYRSNAGGKTAGAWRWPQTSVQHRG